MVSQEIYELSIVFVGDFNPVIIQPYWLAHKKLIREQEANNSEVEIIHNELVRIDLKWAKIEVTKNRFEIKTTNEPYFEPIRDLMVSIFTILKETPIKMLGINHTIHYAINDEKKYFDFGNKLAPLENWNYVFKMPKVVHLEIFEEQRLDGLKGSYRVRILPSDLLERINYGVSINLNDHFDISHADKEQSGELVNLLQENWIHSMELAKIISEGLWKKLAL